MKAKHQRIYVGDVIAALPPDLRAGRKVLKKAKRKFAKLARRGFRGYRLRFPLEG